MDPITTAVVAAVLAGATKGVTETGKSIIVDSYKALKAKITQKFGPENKISKTIKDLEEEPDIKSLQALLTDRIKGENADKDEEILQLVYKLTEALKTTPEGKSAIKTVTINISDNAQVGVAGSEKITIEGGITFHNKKD